MSSYCNLGLSPKELKEHTVSQHPQNALVHSHIERQVSPPTSFFKGLCREGLRDGQRVVTEQLFLLLQDLIYLDFLLLKTVRFDYFPHSLQEQSVRSAQNCSFLSYNHFKNLSVEFSYMALSNFCLREHHKQVSFFHFLFFNSLDKDHEHTTLGSFSC